MNIDISKYPVRRSNPIIHGSYGLPDDTERYIVKGQGLIGIDLDKGDNLYFKNLEGNQVCEITIFDQQGNNNQNVIGEKKKIEDSFLKQVLKKSSDKFFLIQKLENKKINLNNFSSSLLFNESSKRNDSEEILISENCFTFLDAPVLRCSSLDSPVPFASELEKNFLAKSRLKSKIMELSLF